MSTNISDNFPSSEISIGSIDSLKEKLLTENFFTKNKRINKSRVSNIVKSYKLQDNDGDTDIEKLYIILYGREFCKVCGGKVKFISWNTGYNKTCCVECQSKYQSEKGKIRRQNESEDTRKNRLESYRKTCLSRYGVESTSQLEFVKDKIKTTNILKYGVPYVSQSDEIKEKTKETCIKKYGVTCSLKTESALEKTKNTNILKYGVDNVFKLPSVQEQCRKTIKEHYSREYLNSTSKKSCLEKYGVEYYSQTSEYKEKVALTRKLDREKFERDNDCLEIKEVFLMFGTGWKQSNKFTDKLLKYKGISYVPKYLLGDIETYYNNSLKNKSHSELEVLDFCKEILGKEVEIISSDRNTIKNSNGNYLELDIHIIDKDVAIEYNGIRWHALDKIGDKNYHRIKSDLCNEKGIRLLHIWEDLWKTKKDIYKSIISSALGVYDHRIYARNCKCVSISSKEYEDFLEKNHIQGKVSSSLRLGLIYNNELVQVVGWGKSRFKKGEYELHRMCSRLNTQVVGGFSKLIKHSGLDEFISYVDKDLYNGKGYQSCGFENITETEPSYFYYKDGFPRVNRISTQKSKLKKLLGDKFDETRTEKENMVNNGYNIIYNCGNYKVCWKSTNKRG